MSSVGNGADAAIENRYGMSGSGWSSEMVRVLSSVATAPSTWPPLASEKPVIAV